MSDFVLRDYQEEAVAAVFKEWEEAHSTLGVAMTGMGKTAIAVEIVRRRLPKRAIFLAHRSELIFQARQAFLMRGIECEIEKAELTASTNLFTQAPVVLATVQTLGSGEPDKKRMQRLKPKDFDTLIYDECFPAGTLVDGRPIEEIKVGESVTTGSIVPHKVLKTFKNKPKSLVRISFADGTELICTGNHPIWDCSFGCFIPASMLTYNSVALRLTIYEERNKNIELRHLRETDSVEVLQASKTVRGQRLSKKVVGRNNGINKQKARISKDEEKESNARPRVSSEDVSNIAGYWTQAGRKRWERKAANSSGSPYGSCSGLGNWCPYTYRMLERCEWDAPALHHRRGKQSNEGGDRNRRAKPLQPPRAGQEERLVLRRIGVDGVEVLEQGSDGTFGGLCPDGYVYNLHVETDNTYWANGLLVHNCHHSVSVGNKKIVDYFVEENPDIKVIGISATPDRSDELALGQIFETVAFEFDCIYGIDNGWLIEPEQQMVTLGDLDFSHMRTTAGDLNGADLKAAMEAESNIQGVVQPTLEAMYGLIPNTLAGVPHEQWAARLAAGTEPSRTIVFTVSVAQAETLSNIFNRVVEGVSSWVCGKTPDSDRANIFQSFGNGGCSILVNCGVTTEGYDNPAVSLIVVARPTKSRSLYAQMIGRGTRPLPKVVDGLDTKEERLAAIAASSKPSMLVLDFVGNSGKHKLITTADILGGKYSDEAVEKATERMKQEKTKMQVREVIEEEEEKIRLEAERKRQMSEALRAKLVAKVKYSSTKVNPFDAFALSPVQDRGWEEGKRLSDKQRHMLMKQGIDPDTMGYAAGRQLLNEMFRRFAGKLATFKQAALLKKHYPEIDVKTLKMDVASKMIDALAKNGWRRT